MIVTLTGEEYERISNFVRDRREYKQSLGIPRDDPNKSTGIVLYSPEAYNYDVQGTLAEYATTKALGLPFDDAITRGGDRGYDLKVGELRADVKFSTHRDGHLIIPRLPCLRCVDIFIYVEPGPSPSAFDLNLRGVISRKKVEEHLYWTDLGHGTCWVVDNRYIPQFDLHYEWLLKKIGEAKCP